MKGRTGRVARDQPFVPVILGGDLAVYVLAREFHEAYGVRSVALPGSSSGLLARSVALDVRPIGSMREDAHVVAQLIALARELNPDGSRPLLLFGCMDLHVMLIARHREELSRYYTVTHPTLQQIEHLGSKEVFADLAKRLDVPHPATVIRQRGDDLTAAVDAIALPWIIKPVDSAAWNATSFSGKRKVYLVEDASQASSIFASIDASGYDAGMVIQDRIPGGDHLMRLALFVSGQDGKVAFAAPGRTVLEEHGPVMEGNSAAIISVADDDIVELGRRILDEIGWVGPATLDAKVDERDGTIKALEINPRLGRNHYYVTGSGVNVARLLTRVFIGEEAELTPLTGHPATTLTATSVSQPTGRILYSTFPLALVAALTRGRVHADVRALALRRRSVNPLYYSAERHPLRWAYIAASSLNYLRKYGRDAVVAVAGRIRGHRDEN